MDTPSTSQKGSHGSLSNLSIAPFSVDSNRSVHISSDKSSGDPHQGFFYALPYLHLREILAVQMTCRSIRDAVNEEGVVWQKVSVRPPLSGRLTDELLIMKVVSKARGRMRALALTDCGNITDSALLQVASDNRKISMLNLQGCTSLTPEGVIQAARALPCLKQIRINGLLSITSDHLDTLDCLLGITQPYPSIYYNGWQSQPTNLTNHPIDVSICPMCREARLIFDCPRDECRKKTLEKLGSRCWGCYWCVPRCEGCSGCMGFDEVEEMAACSHLLCSECWLRLPKCVMCNRPLCRGHDPLDYDALFTCQRCSDREEKQWDD